ncbi:MAG: glycosyltransferase family 2 protein [Synechococcaceae cyanobacterium SM2_3_1]|nr:glycosyltransferase family 2 protein [Synechococcaceae cyanobacterium SM2_3_1]
MYRLSVIIPTYNRFPILQKCLGALKRQAPGEYSSYEVIVVDDGSSDATVPWLEREAPLPQLRLIQQEHRGPAAARNLGLSQAQGSVIIFIDSDLVVTSTFLASHARLLALHGVTADPTDPGDAKLFSYGRVINTHNFEFPAQEPFKPTDFSNAFFATGNVAIARHWLDQAAESAEGPFDTRFQLYGWEDLELGVRLKTLGLRMIKCPEAVGYHWHPPFHLNQIPALIERERQRGRMGVLFWQKHPTWEVRLMIQMTALHRILWGILSLGGWLNEKRVAPLLQWLIDQGKPQLALELCRIFFLNWYNVQAVYNAHAELQHHHL